MAKPRQMMGSVDNRQVIVHNAYIDQAAPRANRFTERNPLVWLCKASSDRELSGPTLYTPMHLMHN
jgi:hypothetical protein